MPNLFPYTNTHELNLDWVLQVVKDFQTKYTTFDQALSDALDAIEAAKTGSLEDMQTALTSALETISANLASAQAAISADQASAQAAISADQASALQAVQFALTSALATLTTSEGEATARINSLYNTLPASAQDILGKLNILDAIITGAVPESFVWLQGDYIYTEGTTPPTPPAINTESQFYTLRVSSRYITGVAGQRIRIITDGTIEIAYVLNWKNTPPGGSAGAYVPGEGGLTETFFDLLIPLDVTAISIELKKPGSGVAISPSDIDGHIEIQWITDFVSQRIIAPTEESLTANVAREAGELFFYDGVLYTALEDIAIGDTIILSGAGANCEETTVGEEINILKSNLTDISELVSGRNKCNPDEIRTGRYVRNADTGWVIAFDSTENGFATSGIIPIEGNYVTPSCIYNDARNVLRAQYVLFDDTRTPRTKDDSVNPYLLDISSLNLDYTPAYITISWYTSTMNSPYFVGFSDTNTQVPYEDYLAPYYMPKGVYELQNIVNPLESNVEGLLSNVSSIYNDFGISIAPGELTSGGYINYANGSVVSIAGYKYSDYIEIGGIARLGVKCVFNDSAGFAFYDENKVFIAGYGRGTASQGDMIQKDVPDGAYYLRFSFLAWLTITPAIKIYNIQQSLKRFGGYYMDQPCDYPGAEISVFNKILCVGDSLTKGVFNYRAGGTTNNFVEDEKYSYPTYLKKLTGVDTTNMGIGGYTSDQWYAAKENADLSGYDAAIIMLGVNDCIQYSTFGSTTETALGNIITKLKNENENIKIFVANIIPATAYSSEAFVTFSNALLAWVQTEYASDNDVIALDIQQYGHTMDSSAYNCGHLSALGYARLAQDYKAYISYYIKSHLMQFQEVQFIGTDKHYHE